MNILIISREKIPRYIEYYLQRSNVKLFYAKGNIKCQFIFNEVKINYILLFIDRNLKKVLDDILVVINRQTIPVIVFAKQQINNLTIANHCKNISLKKDEVDIVSELDFYLNTSNNKNTKKTKEFSNLIFKNFFKKILKKNFLSNIKPVSSFTLSSNLNVSGDEKNALLKDLRRLAKKK